MAWDGGGFADFLAIMEAEQQWGEYFPYPYPNTSGSVIVSDEP